jgi:hypothetical protein
MRPEASLLEIEVTADSPDLSFFASPALAVPADQSLWSFVVPREMSFQGGRFTARVLRDSAPPTGHPIRVSFQGREGRFTVHFPAEVAQSNGESRERLANWSFPLARLCDQPVEMTAVTRADVPIGALALGALLLLGLAVLFGSILRKRRAAGASGTAG